MKVTDRTSLSNDLPGVIKKFVVIVFCVIWLSLDVISGIGTFRWVQPFGYGLFNIGWVTTGIGIIIALAIHVGRAACGFAFSWKRLDGLRLLFASLITIFTCFSIIGSYQTNLRSVEVASNETNPLQVLQERKDVLKQDVNDLRLKQEEIPGTWKKWTWVQDSINSKNSQIFTIDNQIGTLKLQYGVDKIRLSRGIGANSRLAFWIIMEFVLLALSFIWAPLVDWGIESIDLKQENGQIIKVKDKKFEDSRVRPQIRPQPAMGFQSHPKNSVIVKGKEINSSGAVERIVNAYNELKASGKSFKGVDVQRLASEGREKLIDKSLVSKTLKKLRG